MVITVKPEIMFRLMSYAAITRDEFSGFGFCERKKSEDGKDTVIEVYDFVLLDVGDYVYTEIRPEKFLPLMSRPDRKNMKVWLHRHPVGNGIPGPHNWSGTDEHTIRREPLGTTPEAANWSVSMVLTPGGWVGRIDNYLTGKTQHLEVLPSTRDLLEEVRSLVEQPPFGRSTSRRGSKSRKSREVEFPTSETPVSAETPRKKKTAGTRKKSSKGLTWTNIQTRLTTAKRLIFKMSTSFWNACVGSSTQLPPPSRTSATTTPLTGAGYGEDEADDEPAPARHRFHF